MDLLLCELILEKVIPGIRRVNDKRFVNFNAETESINRLSERIIEAYEPNLPKHILFPARGGLIWGPPIYQILRKYAIDNNITLPEPHIFISVYYTGEEKRALRPEFYGLEEIISKIDNGEDILIIDDVIETGNTPHFAVEEIQEKKNVTIRTAAPFYKPSKNKHPDMFKYLIYLFEVNDWIVFTHEKADFGKTSELMKVLRAKGQEQIDILLKDFEGINIKEISDPNRFYLSVLDWSSKILYRTGTPEYVYAVFDKRHLSDYNEGIFPVELNELARIYPRIKEVRKRGINSDSFKDYKTNKVPFGVIVVDNEDVSFVGEKPKKGSTIYIASNQFHKDLPLTKILKYFNNEKVRFFSMFPSPAITSSAYFGKL